MTSRLLAFLMLLPVLPLVADGQGKGCDPEYLVGEWVGEMKQYSYNIYATYPVLLKISSVEGCEFKGSIHYPSQDNGITRVKGLMQEDTIIWTETDIINGSDYVLGGLYLVEPKNKTMLQGKWYTPDSALEGGSFSMSKVWEEVPVPTDQPIAEAKPNKGNKPGDNRAKPKPIKKPDAVIDEKNIPQALLDRPVEKSAGDVKVYKSDIVIQIWDSKTVDGDVISLNYNGKWLLRKHKLTERQISLSIKVDPKLENNYLVLYAEDMGATPPSTTSIQFYDGRRVREMYLRSDLKHCGAVNFTYDP